MALQEIDPRRKFDIEESWKRLDLNEGGKLLALFHAALAYAHQDLIDEDKIEIYAYLMKTNGLIPFRSPFKFNPVPYSEGLSEHLSGLVRAGFIKRNTGGEGEYLSIVSKGTEWAENTLTGHGVIVEGLLAPVGREIKRLSQLSSDCLSREVFATMERRSPLPSVQRTP